MRERATPGLHDAVVRLVDGLVAVPSVVADLGAGDGALSLRLAERGHRVWAVDLELPIVVHERVVAERRDLNTDPFSSAPEPSFDAVLAVEVIEHLENPVGFLRSVASVLAPDGIAIVTTPNVDGFSSRLRFLRRGQLRGMGEGSDPTHITPVTWWMLVNRWLPLAGLGLERREPFPRSGRVTTSEIKHLFNAVGSAAFRTEVDGGRNHILVLRRRS